jgi:hypothetical protein
MTNYFTRTLEHEENGFVNNDYDCNYAEYNNDDCLIECINANYDEDVCEDIGGNNKYVCNYVDDSNKACVSENADANEYISDNTDESNVYVSEYVENNQKEYTDNISTQGVTEMPGDDNLNRDQSSGDPLIDTLHNVRLKHPKNIVIAHVNINSIRNKFDYIYNVLSKGLTDILCITETKVDESFTVNCFICPGYKCYRKDRNINSGGMMIFVREDIPHTRISAYEINSEPYHIESLVLYFEIKKQKFHLMCLYKNPKVANNVFISLTCDMLNKLTSDGNDIVLLGDLNVDMSDSDNIVDNEICDVYGLKNIIRSPTCFKSEKGTLLDPVLVSNASKFCMPFNEVCGASDWHNMVGCVTRVSCPVRKPFKIQYRSYKTFNECNFQNDVSLMPKQICDVFDDVSDQYWAFNVMYSDILNEHAPIKQRTVKGDKIPYMYSDLMKQMYRRNMLKNKFFKSRTSKNWENYKKQRNYVTSLRKKAIKSYFQKKCTNVSKPKDFWNCVKPFFSDKSTNDTRIILKEDDNIVSNSEDVANVLNNYFINIADSINCTDLKMEHTSVNVMFEYHSCHSSIQTIESNVSSNNEVFEFKEITCDVMFRKLRSIKTNKSSGYDHITPKSVKLCTKELTMPLTSLVNNAFKSSSFPDDMKKAQVCPIFKKKDHMAKENYRPINLISIFAKIFESIITDQINEYMSTKFNERLGAYRKGHGCGQVLTLAIDTWKWSLDDNMYVGALLMDLSKAFDAIPHDLLICKMYAYGFSENACKFMLSYLSNRTQRVKVQDTFSSWKNTKRGIPQGSCLGPLLFNLFINDIFNYVQFCQLFNYADDNTVSASDYSTDEVLKKLLFDTNVLMAWFNDNFMKVMITL